jgi:arabinofuranan 3-O-arabinosyltransferase
MTRRARHDAGGATAARSRLGRFVPPSLSLAALAAVAYIPMLLTDPGLVAADTKQYLYLDPGRLITSALSVWDPSVAAGQVTHENIGYVYPQGPFYWIFAQLGVPVWVAQRLWVGTLLFAAGAGVWYLARVLGFCEPGGAISPRVGRPAGGGAGAPDTRPRRGTGAGAGAMEAAAFLAGLMYMLSPYFLQYSQRISAILAPWSGLGWLVAFTVLAVRRGGWRYPALFGLVVATVSGTNASSVIYVGLAPALYLPYALFVSREASVRRVLTAAWRIVLFSLGASLWWIAALSVESTNGINVLKFTETVPAIASTSVASEVLRGLGYWYFYGGDTLGQWLTASVDYMTKVALIVVSFAVPALALLAAVCARWRDRAYFVLLVLVGLVFSVGTFPYTSPSVVGRGLRTFMSDTTAGFAMRSTDRATPLVILGLAMLLGGGASALLRRIPRTGLLLTLLASALVVANGVPFLTGAAVAPKFARPTRIPSYVTDAAGYLGSQGDSTRVLLEPGQDFGAYDWGTTTDPVWPGLTTRPTLQRQQLIEGSIPTADLLDAFDLTLQEGTYDPSTLVPIARLFSAGDVVLQSNLNYWWYNTPKPVETWPLFEHPPPGAGAPVSFGPKVADSAPAPYANVNEATLALPPDPTLPPALAVFPVSDARPIYRAEPAAAPLVIDGDGSGVVAAAASGLLADNPTIFYSGSLSGDARLAAEALTPGADLVLTDSNGKELRRWTTIQDNVGELEPASPVPAPPDASAVPLIMFPQDGNDAYTTAVYHGAVYVTASGYGNPISYTPEDRPYEAFDGNVDTAWTVAAFSTAEGNWIEVKLPRPVSVDRLNLVQPLTGDPDRWITRVEITFDGGRPVYADLGPSSRTAAGQTVTFPRRSFTTLRITVERTNLTGHKVGGLSGVGFAEIAIPGVSIGESEAMPTDMLELVGQASLSHRLTILMTRDRVSPIPPRSDPELAMARSFWLPTARTFTLSGAARISALIPDNFIDDLLGGPDVFGGIVVGSDARLPGDLDARAVFAFDGKPGTAWMPGFGTEEQLSSWMELAIPRPLSFNHLDLAVIADGRHSVPTAIRITTNDGGDVLVHLPPIADRSAVDATVSVPVSFPSITGSVIRFSIAAIRPVETEDYYSLSPITMPVGIAEVGIPGFTMRPENPRAPLPDICRSNLLTIDGKPVDIRVVGTVGEAETLQGLQIEGCGADAKGIALGAGYHDLQAAWGKDTGYDLDSLVLDSAPGGGPMPLGAGGQLAPAPGTLASTGSAALAAPSVRVLSSSATHASLEVAGARSPFWLVLGQSINSGWAATLADGSSLGAPVLIDGYANAWYVHPPAGGGAFTVSLSFLPQQRVDDALVASALVLVLCLCLALWPRRLRLGRRRRGAIASRSPARDGGPDDPPAGPDRAGVRPGLPRLPHLALPVAGGGRRPGVITIALLALVCGAVAAALLPPTWAVTAGLAVFAAAIVACLLSWSRSIVALGAVGFAVAAGLATAIGQVHERLPADASWPAHFAGAGILTWFAVLALAVDAVVELARRGRPTPTASAPAQQQLEVPSGELAQAGDAHDAPRPGGVVAGTGVEDLDVAARADPGEGRPDVDGE